MKKKIMLIGAVLVLCIASLCGCGKTVVDFTEMEIEKTALAVRKEGKLQSALVADFDKDYYTVDGLKEYIRNQIEEYERVNGGEVTLESVEKKNNKVTVVFSYDSTESFAGFHEAEGCFVGNVGEAKARGEWPASFLETEDSENVPASAVEDKQKTKVVILCPAEDMEIKVEGEIKYLSGSIFIDEQTAGVDAGDTAVVVYEE